MNLLSFPQLCAVLTLTITKRMKQFPEFCSSKCREAFRKIDVFPVEARQFPIKIQKIPSNQFTQILQIWVLTTHER